MVVSARFVPATPHLFPREASLNSTHWKSFCTTCFPFMCSVIHEQQLCARLGTTIKSLPSWSLDSSRRGSQETHKTEGIMSGSEKQCHRVRGESISPYIFISHLITEGTTARARQTPHCVSTESLEGQRECISTHFLTRNALSLPLSCPPVVVLSLIQLSMPFLFGFNFLL